jgi:hypothetical protein
MAILYGTMGDGTTLPVLVDQFGNLLAKGIEGAEGPPGEEGPPGPPGPTGNDGLIQWPPNPEEGDVLTWVDGSPQWTSAGPPLQNVWSNFLTSESGEWAAPEFTALAAFDGSPNTAAVVNGAGSVIFAPPDIPIATLRFSTTDNGALPGYTYRVTLGAIQQNFPDGGDASTWFSVTRAAGSTINEQTPFKVDVIKPNGTRANGSLSRLEVNGEVLVDSNSQFRQFYRELLKRSRSDFAY